MLRVRSLRKEHGYTQTDLAALLNVTQTAVSQWEQRRTMPDIAQLTEMSKIFKVSIDYILGIDKPAIPEEGKPVEDLAREYSIRFKNLSPQSQERALHYLGLLENQDNDQSP